MTSPHPKQADGRVHGAIIGVPRQTDGRWLLIRRSERVAAPLQVAFPGGGIEPGESFEDAAVREAKEEVGLDVTLRAQVWDYLSPHRPIRLIGFLAEPLNGQAVTPDPEEVAEVLWLTADEVAAHPDIMPGTDEFARQLESRLVELS